MILTPAKGVAYTFGERTIRDLLDLAQRKLGDAFRCERSRARPFTALLADEVGSGGRRWQEFHDVVLSEGAVSLSTLTRIVERWLDDKAKAEREAPTVAGVQALMAAVDVSLERLEAPPVPIARAGERGASHDEPRMASGGEPTDGDIEVAAQDDTAWDRRGTSRGGTAGAATAGNGTTDQGDETFSASEEVYEPTGEDSVEDVEEGDP
jgi:hypothetical protein